jgi:hypothetical protein
MRRCASSSESEWSRSKLFCSPTHHWQRHCPHKPQKFVKSQVQFSRPCSWVRTQAVTTKATSPHLSPDPTVISLQQYDDCELLWLQYGRQLSLSKQATFWVLQVSWVPARVLAELLLHLRTCITHLHSVTVGLLCGAHATTSPEMILLCLNCCRTYSKASCHVMQSC